MLQGYRVHPQNPAFAERLAAYYLARDDSESAREILEESIDRFSRSTDIRQALLMLVQLFRQTGDSDVALQTLKESIRKFPNDILLKAQLLNFTQVNQNQEEVFQIIEEIKKTEGIEGTRWRYEQARAWLHAGDVSGKQVQIVELLNDILKKNPYDGHAALLLGRTYEIQTNGLWHY